MHRTVLLVVLTFCAMVHLESVYYVENEGAPINSRPSSVFPKEYKYGVVKRLPNLDADCHDACYRVGNYQVCQFPVTDLAEVGFIQGYGPTNDKGYWEIVSGLAFLPSAEALACYCQHTHHRELGFIHHEERLARLFTDVRNRMLNLETSFKAPRRRTFIADQEDTAGAATKAIGTFKLQMAVLKGEFRDWPGTTVSRKRVVQWLRDLPEALQVPALLRALHASVNIKYYQEMEALRDLYAFLTDPVQRVTLNVLQAHYGAAMRNAPAVHTCTATLSADPAVDPKPPVVVLRNPTAHIPSLPLAGRRTVKGTGPNVQTICVANDTSCINLDASAASRVRPTLMLVVAMLLCPFLA